MEKRNKANPEAAASCRFKSNAITEEPASLQSYNHSTGPKLSGSMYLYIALASLCSRHRDNAERPASQQSHMKYESPKQIQVYMYIATEAKITPEQTNNKEQPTQK